MDIPEQKKQILSSFRIFSSLPDSGISGMAACSAFVACAKGDSLFSAGDASTGMYILVTGEMSVIKEPMNENETETEIARLVGGDSLGEIDMIAGTPWTVTVRALEDSTLLQFPSNCTSFHDYVESDPETGSVLLYSFIKDIADRTRRANAVLKENSPHIQELRRQIYEDKLTGLFNKTYLEENLPSMLSRDGKPLALLMFKPDNFKQVNDLSGHEAGDGLLIHLARAIPGALPEGTTIIRYNGNEFGVILQNTGRSGAIAMAEKIKAFYNNLDISKFLALEGFHLTVSIGIAMFPEHATEPGELIEAAHRLPLVGRGRGGNKILFPEDCTEGQA
jgi:diguanylate cyclase (GGDEF)-like protein